VAADTARPAAQPVYVAAVPLHASHDHARLRLIVIEVGTPAMAMSMGVPAYLRAWTVQQAQNLLMDLGSATC
jgi:hypothetical protein